MSQAGIINVSGGGGSGSPIETLTGNTGGAVPPIANNINIIGSGAVTVTGNAATGTLTISVANDGFVWTDEATSFLASPQNGYFCTATLTATLPSAPVQGSTVIIYVDGMNVVTIQANTGQFIQVGDSVSVVGGVAVSSPLYTGSTLTLTYRVADTTWHTISSLASWAVT